MARFTCIFFGLTIVGLFLAGTLLIVLDRDNKIYTSQDFEDNPLGYELSIAAGGLFAFFIVFDLLHRFWERKSHQARKGNGFPDRRNKILELLTTCYTVIFLLLIQWPVAFIVNTLLYYTIGLCLSDKKKRALSGAIFRFQFFVWVNPFWKLKVVGKRPKVKPGSLFMSNHLTFSDAFIASAALWPIETKYIATSWVYKIPLAGPMAKRSGDLAIKFVKQPDGGFKIDKDVVAKTMKSAGEYLDGGENLFVFPEGTLSANGDLKEFKGSAFFRLAMEKEIEIVPMAMWGNQTLWLHGQWTPQPGYCEVTFGDPIKVYADDDVNTVKLKVRNAILDLRESLPLYQATKNLTLSNEVINPLANKI